MATIYEATCQSCHHTYELCAGPLRSGPTFACQRCGKDLQVPDFAPPDSSELEMRGLARLLVTKPWPQEGRDFSRKEREELLLLAIADGCECGGAIVEDKDDGNIRYCCPICKSDRIAREATGLAD